jgi:folliculin-interacting protein 2
MHLPSKILMSLSSFEPNHLGHQTVSIAHDYHLDLALSLIASVATTYSSDFILQGIQTSSSADVVRAILAQHTYDISENGCQFLNDEPIDASITILINLDELTVNLYSSKQQDIARRQQRTKLIQPLIEHAHLAKNILPADFVLMNIEDGLQEIYYQALAILKYIRANKRSVRIR